MRFPFAFRTLAALAALAASSALALSACKTDPATIPDATSDSLGGDDGAEVLPDATTDAATEISDDTADTTPDTANDTADATLDASDSADALPDTSADTTDTAGTADTTEDSADTADSHDTTASCGAAEDCQNCTWGQPVASVADCYCPICPSTPLTKTECVKNQADWQTHCTTWAETNPCPVPRCLPLAEPLCEDSVCIANPNACFDSADCGTCRFPKAPKSQADCACPTCPAPANITHCEAIEDAIAEHCSDFDFESCPLPNCPRPPAIGCTNERICGYGDLLPEER